jgi:hypothetical protein
MSSGGIARKPNADFQRGVADSGGSEMVATPTLEQDGLEGSMAYLVALVDERWVRSTRGRDGRWMEEGVHVRVRTGRSRGGKQKKRPLWLSLLTAFLPVAEPSKKKKKQ